MSRVSPLCRLRELGQSVWLDYIERGFLARGELAQVIREDGVTGVTSNPAIFHKAITEYGSYDEDIVALVREGLQAHDIYEALVIADIQSAADILKEVHVQSAGRDGFVSLEVSPHLARDAEESYREGKRLWTRVARPNLMIKVPGTLQGIEAIRRLTAEGINVNVTLLFSVERYVEVAHAFIEGLEQRSAAGQSINGIASVASFFLSRIDTLIDKQIAQLGDSKVQSLKGEAAIACARLAYRRFESIVDSSRWAKLASQGANAQRLLWASTGTKNPAYSDTKYVEALIGPDTVTTLPIETLSAYRDHGDPSSRLNEDPEYALEVIAQLQARAIGMAKVAAELEEDGLKKFVQPFDASHDALRDRIKRRAVS